MVFLANNFEHQYILATGDIGLNFTSKLSSVESAIVMSDD